MIEDDKGRKLKALTVFSMSIKFLKDHLVNTLSNSAVFEMSMIQHVFVCFDRV